MLKIIRIVIILASLIGSLWWFNSGISKTNAIRDHGETMLLKLRPVDPRALMQGDFMALGYDRSVYPTTISGLTPTGSLILIRDQNQVAKFRRLGNTEPLSAQEVRVKYAIKNGKANYGAARYFFQEGTAKIYENAKYGVFKVSEEGSMVLIGLADEKFKTLSAPK